MPRVTMSTIAAQAGVSKNTVSLALRHDPQIPPETRRRIERVARDLGYTKNPVISQLMTELRKVHPAGHRRAFALLNANGDLHAFTRHPTVPACVAGCRRRAAQLGYTLDEFWLHSAELYGERLNRVLRSRGIRGVIVVGLTRENRLPSRFSVTWQNHSVVVVGTRTREPALHHACVDHHALVLEAMERARLLGYRRPALVVERGIDLLVDGRFGAGFWTAQQGLPEADRLPPFLDVDVARGEPGRFHAWYRERRPDVILTLHPVVREWLEQIGARAPRDLGLIQLERRRGCTDWAGMEQHHDLAGEAAVDMLLASLHTEEPGLPVSSRATLTGASWVDGATVRRAAPLK